MSIKILRTVAIGGAFGATMLLRQMMV